jgi:predicted HTH domain antitoxin
MIPEGDIVRDSATREAGDAMEETLTIHLPSERRQMLNRTPEELARDVRLYSALMLFRLGKLSSGAAAEMAGLPRVEFLDLCAEYDIPVTQITGQELRREMDSA